MNRVHDLPGDWFAMPPHPNWDVPLYFSRGHLPAVGDVLANTRTQHRSLIEADGREVPHPFGPVVVWADPPFVRVVEVLPIVTPGGVGWAVRVEASTCPEPDCLSGHQVEPDPSTGEPLSVGSCRTCGGDGYHPPDLAWLGRPLNEQENT